MLGLEVDNHAPPNHHFCIRALWEPNTKEAIPLVKMGSIPMKVSHRVTKAAMCKILKGVKLCSSRP
jgi:hypothetical protein